jgi:radical SAM superfamily enzyme YgiQ (UPF0313 family)
MANLGFQFLYGRLNSHPRLSAERFFLPDSPAGRRSLLVSLSSEESGRPLSQFPLIAFSIPFENDYPAIPGALMASGIPPLQKDRNRGHPIVMAGGIAVSLNPEPLAPFLDLVFIGEVEEGPLKEKGDVFSVIAGTLDRSLPFGEDRDALLHRFRDLPSVYVPYAYQFYYDEKGLIKAINPEPGFPNRVQAAKRMSMKEAVPVSVLSSPEAEFGESFLVEANRGCGRGCRFCAAGWMHLPARYARLDRFREDLEQALREGRPIGLVGSDLAGHPELEEILQYIVDQGGSFSLSSIRPEGLTPKVIELLKRAGHKTVTLAPETASPRMKKVIGKPISAKKFYDLVEKLVAAGIPNIRFYFMIGLPTETDEDVAKIADFVIESRKIFVEASRSLKKIGAISVQVNPFVPKPWTPFQWAAATPPDTLERRILILRRALRNQPNLTLRIESPRTALVQAVLSRGDRRAASIVLAAAQQDGRWSGVFKKEMIDPAFFALRERGVDEIFPWEVTDHGIARATLWKVYSAALAAGKTKE